MPRRPSRGQCRRCGRLWSAKDAKCRHHAETCSCTSLTYNLYGIAKGAVDHIMETFPIVKRKDVAAYGEYRTKRVILEVYDAIQQAMESGRPYQTLLDPPPADARVAHAARCGLGASGAATARGCRKASGYPTANGIYPLGNPARLSPPL